MRGPRKSNMAECWSVPFKEIDNGRPFMDFPELAPDAPARERVRWWNQKLEELDQPGLKIVAGALMEIPLSRKGWL